MVSQVHISHYDTEMKRDTRMADYKESEQRDSESGIHMCIIMPTYKPQ